TGRRSDVMRMAVIAWILAAATLSAQVAPAPSANPVEPVAAIVDAFRTHDVVAVSEASHGEEWGYTFLMSLLDDPRIVTVVDDVVIENGSARYQSIADRFVYGGHVSPEDLSQAWRNTVTPGLGDDEWWLPVFQRVRAINSAHPGAHQMRILLGDPP